MTTCAETHRILELHSGGRARWEGNAALRLHFEACAACGREVAAYLALVQVARAAWPANETLSDAVHARVTRAAAEQAARGTWWSRLVPMGRITPAWAAVAPAALVALVVALPMALRRPAVTTAGAVPARIEMQAGDGSVSLAWSDGNDKTYRVYKSSDPRQLGRGKPNLVRGNQWVDQDPDSSPIVFYRVE